jgi:hypothetical protein
METPASLYPTLSVSTVVAAVRARVGDWGLAGLLDVALAMLTYRRIGRIAQQIERLLVRFRAGALWRMPERMGDGVAGRVDRPPGDRPAMVLPVRFGWLVRAAAWRAAVYGGQLQLVLEQPEMVELLKASPQAGRILRPLCRMLLVDTAILRPGVVVEVPIPKVVKVRVRKPRAKVDWGRIPLPRGMLAAARRQGFGKLPKD